LGRIWGVLPADDYAKAAFFLQNPARPAYVSFATSAHAHGIARDDEPEHVVYVRTSDGAVVYGSLQQFSTGHYAKTGDTNPVSRPAFKPQCYAAAGEAPATWDGRQVLRLSLRSTCRDADGDPEPFDALYADPATLQPLGASGAIQDEGVSVTLEERFARFGAYVFASSLSAHVTGHGWLFWVRERADVTYENYAFYERLPGTIRRQAGAER